MILKKLQKVEDAIIVASFALMVICSFASVVNRNFIKIALPWLDEMATFCMIYMALLGTEEGLRDGSQIAVTALVNKFHGLKKMYLQIISKSIVTVFSGIVFGYSVKMVIAQGISGQMSAALHIPIAIPYMALVISFGIITVIQGITVLKMIYDASKGKFPKDRKEVQA
jgi:C4-dicarboxylate transporter DctQ subunit